MYNKENLLRMADYIETVPQEKFDMEDFRHDLYIQKPECNSIGCIVGHCTVLDAENVDIKYTNPPGRIDFASWIEEFTGVTFWDRDFDWLFGPKWVRTDNTPTGAAKRIRHFVEHGLPDDWEQIMNGEKPLPYEKHS